MMADLETTGWIAGAMAAMGVGGGFPLLRMFSTQSNHSARIKRLEEDREKDSQHIEKTHTAVTQLQGSVERAEEDIASILGLLRSKE